MKVYVIVHDGTNVLGDCQEFRVRAVFITPR